MLSLCHTGAEKRHPKWRVSRKARCAGGKDIVMQRQKQEKTENEKQNFDVQEHPKHRGVELESDLPRAFKQKRLAKEQKH